MRSIDLIELYILQKEYHEAGKEKKFKELYDRKLESLLGDKPFSREYMLADPINTRQPKIPFVLFKPNNLTARKPAPLIIYTHGGPNVYFYKEYNHADIEYHLSKGYVVACPNYRGSTDHPDLAKKTEWLEWKAKAEGLYHVYGPEDVYAVTEYMLQMPYVDKTNVFLRGGSFGSFINAHLLAQIKKGKYKNIYKGAHFSGGVNFPSELDMPDDMHILITHGEKDDIAPPEDAKLFAKGLLLNQLAIQKNDSRTSCTIQTFFSSTGNHHLIDANLSIDSDKSSQSYKDLARYLELKTTFIDNLVETGKYITERAKTQLVTIDGENYNGNKLEQEVSITQIRREEYLEESKVKTYGPTMALLKIYLKETFTGNPERDLTVFLRDYFRPHKFETDSEILDDAGNEMLSNKMFFNQLIEMVKNEEKYLKSNPEYMVMYHAAENNVLQIYSFINVWKQIFMQQKIGTLPIINDMRIYNFIKNSFDNIDIFLAKMHKNEHKYPNKVFNNLPGFQERAISCNPSLISNAHSTASCSLWWYFNSKNNERLNTKEIITSFLKILEIDSEDLIERYLDVFKEFLIEGENSTENNALMQQIFVPYEIAKKRAYMCQLWGEEFEANELNLKKTEIMKELISDPLNFEFCFRQPKNKDSVTNFHKTPEFGEEYANFRYSGLLQVRYLSGCDNTPTFSYFRNIEHHNNFVKKLSNLISEDFNRCLSSNVAIPKSIFGETILLSQRKEYNLEVIFQQQKQLYQGLVENPKPSDYSDIVKSSKEEKIILQGRLSKEPKMNTSNIVFLYSLCRYLKGYTYFDILDEALRKATIESENYNLLKESNPFKKIILDKYNESISFIKKFSTPDSIDTASCRDISSSIYARIREILYNSLKSFAFKDSEYSFFNPEPRYLEEYLWELEKSMAIECVLRNARLAKEKINGHKIDYRLEHVYGVFKK